MIHIARNNQQLGQFSEEEVRRGLQDGQFLPTDLGWKEGMPEWQPLSTFDLGAVSPLPQIHLPAIPSMADADQGIAWEKSGGIWSRWWQTTLNGIISPRQTFRGMPTTGGYGPPLVYLILSTFILFFLSLVLQVPMQVIFRGFLNADQMMESGAYSITSLVLVFVLGLFFVPLAAVLTGFLVGGIFHLCLMLFGGASKGFEATYRVTCYLTGALSIVQVLPILGPLVVTFLWPISYVLGLKEAHRTETWRATCAVLLPYLLCCGAIVAILVFAFSAIWESFQQIGGR